MVSSHIVQLQVQGGLYLDSVEVLVTYYISLVVLWQLLCCLDAILNGLDWINLRRVEHFCKGMILVENLLTSDVVSNPNEIHLRLVPFHNHLVPRGSQLKYVSESISEQSRKVFLGDAIELETIHYKFTKVLERSSIVIGHLALKRINAPIRRKEEVSIYKIDNLDY